MNELYKLTHNKQLKFVITGGAGFIGSNIAESLLELGHKVIVVDNLLTGNLQNIKKCLKFDDFDFIKEDIRNQSKMMSILPKADIVIHLAALVGVQKVLSNASEIYEHNLHGTKVILDICYNYEIRTFIASSSEVYGNNQQVPFSENSELIFGEPHKLRWFYGCSKLVDEFLSLNYYYENNFPVTILRFFNIIGPKQTGKYGMVVPTFISQALKVSDITVYGDGKQSRCFTDIRDLITALLFLIRCNDSIGKIINIGGIESISIYKLALLIKDITKSNSKIVKVPYRNVYGKQFVDMNIREPDITQLYQLIKFKPEISIRESIIHILRYNEQIDLESKNVQK